jgi:hypothetical protein
MSDFDWKNLIDHFFYIHFDINGIKLGIYIVLFIVFAETGLLQVLFCQVIVCCFLQESTIDLIEIFYSSKMILLMSLLLHL